MRRGPIVLAISILAILVAIRAQAAPPQSTATPAERAVRRMLDDIRALPSASADRQKLIDEITNTLALHQLSTEALGSYWGKLTDPERDRFVTTLGQVLEKIAYPKAAEFFAGLAVTFGAEQNKGASRVIPTLVKRGAQGEVSIDYVMANQHGTWRAVDIILDGQSLAQSVTEQIQAVLKQGSYEGLIAQMQARLKQPPS